MAKLRVKRKAYSRKAGVPVKTVRVPASTFLIKDRGKPGRTPEKDRFFDPKVRTGRKADMPMAKRRSLALKAHKGDLLATGRSLIALSNVQHRINPDVAAKAKADANYFYRLHAKRKRK